MRESRSSGLVRAAAIGLVVLVASVLAASAQPAATATSTAAAERVLRTVTSVAAGDDTAARRDALVAALRSIGVEPALEPFGSEARRGINLVVTLPGTDARTVLVGAHYDRVAVGRGVVDNAASCAALIELIGALKASPLPRATLTFVFFDREENGLEGSRAFVAAHTARPAYAINLDVFAYGDVMFATASHADGVLFQHLTIAAATAGVAVRDVPRNQYPGSDHLTMAQAGIETLGLAIVDAADVDGILKTGVAGLKPGSGPRILTLIHTPNDTLAELRPEQVVRAIGVLERLLRAL